MSGSPKVYLVRGGKLGEDEEAAIESGLAIIGFRDVPDLSWAREYSDVVELVGRCMPGAKPRAIANRASQLWTFACGWKDKDLIVMPRKGTSQIAIGTVAGRYRFEEVNGERRHTRQVKWVRSDVPRTAFEQDLLYSFGAFMTVCNITRNEAEYRVAEVMAGHVDPGPRGTTRTPQPQPADDPGALEELTDLGQVANDQIVAHIQARFAGHGLSGLVDAVLRADGWVTKMSPPGADGGVDILGGRGSLGLDAPRLCVQVKSQQSPTDVTVYRTLQGTMQTFKAEQGLLVCWGGFNKVVQAEARQAHFTVRLWDSRDLLEAMYRTYERLPAEIQAELPLKRVWMLVTEDLGE
ncbi:MAG: restriction endonuclease [Planctomycetota bacterium]|nr:restriction endonuclease [Planctomycetota bacterium]